MTKLIGLIILATFSTVVIFGVGLLFALPVMLLWDWLMPTIFHLGTITFWQAWGLLVLCGLLFKNVTSSTSSS